MALAEVQCRQVLSWLKPRERAKVLALLAKGVA
jgi:hypothetical protein